MRVQQPETAQTDNFALFTFQQGSADPPRRRRVCSNIHLLRIYGTVRTPRPSSTTTSSSTANRPPPPRIHLPLRYASLPPPEAATLVWLAIRETTATLQLSPLLRAIPRPGNQTALQLALLRGLTQQLSTPPLFSLQTRLLQHPPLSLEQIYAPPPQRQQRHPLYNRTVRNAAPTTNRSSTIASLYKLYASLPPPKLHPSLTLLQHSPLPASSERALLHRHHQ